MLAELDSPDEVYEASLVAVLSVPELVASELVVSELVVPVLVLELESVEVLFCSLSLLEPKPRISVGDQVVTSERRMFWMSSSMPAIVQVKFTRPLAEVDFLQMNVMNYSRSPDGLRKPKSEERSIVPSSALCTWT